jgi:tartrate-resistant acid phosphatase type 5
MVHAARRQTLDFVLNVGDNFYFNGVENIFDSRFEDSFEEIYDHPELLVPWYTIAGNHDHLGNISAQMVHTNFSNKWFVKNKTSCKLVLKQ